MNDNQVEDDITDQHLLLLDQEDQIHKFNDTVRNAYHDLMIFCQFDPIMSGSDFFAYLTEEHFFKWIKHNIR